MDRRAILKGAGAGAAAVIGSQLLPGLSWAAPSLPAGTLAVQALDALPGKQPLIRKSYRPQNYETPVRMLRLGHDAQRFLLRPLPLGRHPGCGCGEVDAEGRRAGRPGAGRVHDGSAEVVVPAGRGGLRSAMLGQPPRIVRSACSGRRMGLRRHGQCPLDRRSAQGCPRQSGCEAGGDRDLVRRRRRTRLRQDARFHEEPARVEGDGRQHADRVPDERPAVAALERVSRPAHRVRLDRHVLDEAPQRDKRASPAAAVVLDDARRTGFRGRCSRWWSASPARRRRGPPTRPSPKWSSTR